MFQAKEKYEVLQNIVKMAVYPVESIWPVTDMFEPIVTHKIIQANIHILHVGTKPDICPCTRAERRNVFNFTISNVQWSNGDIQCFHLKKKLLLELSHKEIV